MKCLEFFELSVVLCICMTVLEVRVGAIIGGEYAREGEIPFMVSVRLFNEFKCGGSLISRNYVLTAAHCVQFPNTTKPVSISGLKVRAGTVNLNYGGVLVNVSEIKVHPSYQSFNVSDYDIALLKLATPLEFTDKLKAIELAKVAVQHGTIILVSGWGEHSTKGSIGTMLRHVNLKVSTDKKCMESYPVYLHTAFCAQKMDKGSCYGDSGGPGVYNGTLVGVIIFTDETCASEFPDGLAKVSIFRDWITTNSDLNLNLHKF